jgi:hypothetical protein
VARLEQAAREVARAGAQLLRVQRPQPVALGVAELMAEILQETPEQFLSQIMVALGQCQAVAA